MRFKLIILLIITNLTAQNISNSLETVINAFNELNTNDRHLTHHLLDIAKNGQNIDSKTTQILTASKIFVPQKSKMNRKCISSQ